MVLALNSFDLCSAEMMAMVWLVVVDFCYSNGFV